MDKKKVQLISQKIYRYCTYRERSEVEVTRKLESFALAPADINKLLRKLRQEDFLNDGRFAKEYVNSKFILKKWGRFKISKKLKEHKINHAIIENALAQIDQTDYNEALKMLAENKWRSLSDQDTLSKAHKVNRFLLQRGFEADMCRKLVQNLIDLETKA